MNVPESDGFKPTPRLLQLCISLAPAVADWGLRNLIDRPHKEFPRAREKAVMVSTSRQSGSPALSGDAYGIG